MTTSREQIIERVNAIAAKLFELDPTELKPETGLFTDLGLDSLDAIDLVISFQRELKIKPETQELESIRTMRDVYDLVERYQEKLARGN